MNPLVSLLAERQAEPGDERLHPLGRRPDGGHDADRRLHAQGAGRPRGEQRHLVVQRRPDGGGQPASKGVHLTGDVLGIGDQPVHGHQRGQGREHRQERVESDASGQHRRLVPPAGAPHPVADSPPTSGAEQGEDPRVVQNAPPPAALNTNPTADRAVVAGVRLGEDLGQPGVQVDEHVTQLDVQLIFDVHDGGEAVADQPGASGVELMTEQTGHAEPQREEHAGIDHRRALSLRRLERSPGAQIGLRGHEGNGQLEAPDQRQVGIAGIVEGAHRPERRGRHHVLVGWADGELQRHQLALVGLLGRALVLLVDEDLRHLGQQLGRLDGEGEDLPHRNLVLGHACPEHEGGEDSADGEGRRIHHVPPPLCVGRVVEAAVTERHPASLLPDRSPPDRGRSRRRETTWRRPRWRRRG